MPLEQIPIRLQLSTASSPSVAPVDANTGLEPQFWRGQSIAIEVGIFDADGVGVDLSNLDYLQVSLFASPTAVAPVVTKTIEAASIIPFITQANWLAGSAQNATAIFSAVDTDQPLGGSEKEFWLAVTGVTTSGNTLVYGAGYVKIFNPGGVPANTPSYVTEHAQTNNSGNTLIAPQSQLHLEILTVGGIARTSVIIVSTIGLIDGARPKIHFVLPATASIILQMRSGTVTGDVIATHTTNGTDRTANYEMYFNGADLLLLESKIPAF